MNSEEISSGYVAPITTESISQDFTDVSIVHTSEYNVLARAQRYGRWYMLKGLNDKARHDILPQQMLRKEFEILVKLQHPNVVQTMGLEQVEGLGTCIVMEYVDGVTLKEWETPALPQQSEGSETVRSKNKESEAVRILDELLQAVAYVHSLDIVHRDLKPQNIMVTRNGAHVKLVDFGLADTSDFAMLKQQAGTANYMAPEQAAVAKPDLRNDIYSLGVVMSEMPLPKYYQKVWSRCLLPIERRYQSIEEMKTDIERHRTLKVRMASWGVAAVVAVLLCMVGLLIWRVNAMDNELNRVAYAKEAAIEALNEEMERTQLTKHTDTLTMWKYRWPDLTQRVMAVNQYCYDYADRLDERFSSADRDRILEAMLSEWQKWQQRINALSTAKVADERRQQVLVEKDE